MSEPAIPDGSEVEYLGRKTWYYATIDGRNFRVCIDEDGDPIIKELVGEVWKNRGESYFPIVDMIFAALQNAN